MGGTAVPRRLRLNRLYRLLCLCLLLTIAVQHGGEVLRNGNVIAPGRFPQLVQRLIALGCSKASAKAAGEGQAEEEG